MAPRPNKRFDLTNQGRESYALTEAKFGLGLKVKRKNVSLTAHSGDGMFWSWLDGTLGYSKRAASLFPNVDWQAQKAPDGETVVIIGIPKKSSAVKVDDYKGAVNLVYDTLAREAKYSVALKVCLMQDDLSDTWIRETGGLGIVYRDSEVRRTDRRPSAD